MAGRSCVLGLMVRKLDMADSTATVPGRVCGLRLLALAEEPNKPNLAPLRRLSTGVAAEFRRVLGRFLFLLSPPFRRRT